MDIVRERLEREYDLELLATMPSVEFDVTLTNGEELEVHNPSDMPDPGTIERDPRAVHPRLDHRAERVRRRGRWSSARSAAASTPACTTSRPSACS